MLRELTIRNLAIIDQCHLTFSEGLTVFTGETGAGKSMIVDALSLLLGKVGHEDMISDGQESAYIEGIFSLGKYASDEDDTLILSRRLQRGKPSVARINGQAFPLKKYKLEVADLLTIAGQHDYMQLLSGDQQRIYLDHFSGANLSSYYKEYDVYQSLLSDFASLSLSEGNKEGRREFLQFQIDDIRSQNFLSDEEEKLISQKMILKQISGVGSALDRVSCGFETMAEHASAARHASESLSKVDSQFDVLCGRVSALDLEIQDILSDVRMHLSDIEMLDASSLEEVESRLDVIFRYKSKYHVQSLSDLMKLSDRLELELKSLDSHGERLLQLQSALADSGVTLKSFAMELSEVRKKAATALSKKIEKEMESLHFEVCNFEIRIDSDYTSYGPNGCDQIQFYVSMNAGSAPKLLSDVASGGELSRIMLAIRSVFSDRFLNRTAVFDEIDAGVGGLTAVKIGEKLHALSQKAQIFCVTHLAQIAKFADHHVTVSKSTSKGKTVTTTHVLSSHERGAELKRMVGGEDVASLIRS